MKMRLPAVHKKHEEEGDKAADGALCWWVSQGSSK